MNKRGGVRREGAIVLMVLLVCSLPAKAAPAVSTDTSPKENIQTVSLDVSGAVYGGRSGPGVHARAAAHLPRRFRLLLATRLCRTEPAPARAADAIGCDTCR